MRKNNMNRIRALIRWTSAVAVVVGAILSLRGQAQEIPYPSALDAAAVCETRLADLNREALAIGNGDLNALLWERQGGLCLRVAKNDVWDARLDTSDDPPLPKVDLANQKWTGGGGDVPSWGRPYPTPRPAAIVNIGARRTDVWHCIRALGTVNEWSRRDGIGVLAIEGNAGASAGYRWDLAPPRTKPFADLKFNIAGTGGARYYVNVYAPTGREFVASGWRDTPKEEQEVVFPLNSPVAAVELFIMTQDGARAENRIRDITLTGGEVPLVLPPGLPPARETAARLDLRRAVATVGGVSVRALADRNVLLIETDQDVSLEEIKAGHLPAAELGADGGVSWLHMKMPGDQDYAGMEYALAVAAHDSRKAVALVTSFDTQENVREAAVQLARHTAAAEVGTLVAAHEAEWARYWAASGVHLDDPDFQNWWYRMVYMLRCFSKPGVVPAGLWAFQPTDAPAWHGDYHHNYNAWQPYWSAFIINHPAQAEPWVDYMHALLPRLKWFAKETYDCEGAFVGISSFAFEPDPAACRSKNQRQIGLMPWGYTMGMIGMSAQVLWHHHLYQPDRAYLEQKIYPVVRETALFFCSFAEKCPRDEAGKAKLGPSYSPEHGGFGVHNVPFDLAYARFSLRAGIAAAAELGRDGELAERFRKALDVLPGYPTAPDAAGQLVVVDWTGCKFRQIGEHNITVPAVPVFPGEQVTWFSPQPEQDLFQNTLRQVRHRGCNSTVMLSVAKARLSMPEALSELRDYYRPLVQPNGMFYWPLHGFYLAESVGVAAGISEFLLQSVDNTIRVFPCWPQGRDAAFANLRAQGGFLVTAEQKAGRITQLEITSTVGGKLRLLNPWTGKIVEQDTQPQQTVVFTVGPDSSHPAAGPPTACPRPGGPGPGRLDSPDRYGRDRRLNGIGPCRWTVSAAGRSGTDSARDAGCRSNRCG